MSKTDVYILGVSGQERHGAAALVRNGRVVAAIEEEKLSRIRHVGLSLTDGVPFRAAAFCLRKAGISWKDVDQVAYYLEPDRLFRREIAFHSAATANKAIPSSEEGLPYYFVESLNGLKQRLRTRALIESKLASPGRFVAVNHQLAHAASAFLVSGFERAACLVVGDVGDMASSAVIVGADSSLKLLREARYPNSIGMVYNSVTESLGFDPTSDWHKTMWLSAEGKPQFAEVFEDLLGLDSNSLPVVNLEYFDMAPNGKPALSTRFFDRVGIQPRQPDDGIESAHRNLAASAQRRTEDVLCEMATRIRLETGEDYLCMAGGVALNGFANSAIERRGGFKDLFIQPAAGNAGCSIGAALHVWHSVLGNKERVYQMKNPFLGPESDQDEIKAVLDNCKLAYRYFPTEDKLIAETASLLWKGRIVGWFRGAMEFGPRTLGARSILASPTDEMMRDNLNRYIKRREEFRPFSAAVPEERLEEFFEASSLSRFLQGVSRVKEARAGSIPAAIFGDGLVRVHSVSREDNRPFWKLLNRFGELSEVPVLLNTSFNLFGEPVVSTPREAVRGFYCSGIDCLAIGNFLIEK